MIKVTELSFSILTMCSSCYLRGESHLDLQFSHFLNPPVM